VEAEVEINNSVLPSDELFVRMDDSIFRTGFEFRDKLADAVLFSKGVDKLGDLGLAVKIELDRQELVCFEIFDRVGLDAENLHAFLRSFGYHMIAHVEI